MVGVEGGRTTVAYTCPEAATAFDDYESKVGVLCPFSTNIPQTVTYGDDYYGISTSTVVSAITVAAVEDCEITATPASGVSASVTASPTCTFSFDGQYADELVALLTCADPSVVGDNPDDPVSPAHSPTPFGLKKKAMLTVCRRTPPATSAASRLPRPPRPTS